VRFANQWPSKIDQLPIFVVSVTTFDDRHRHMNEQARKYNLNLEYIWAFDADVLTTKDFVRFEPDSLPKPSMSAVLKHFEAQRKMVDGIHSVCLVLEDDAILFEGFAEKLERTLHLAKALDPGWLIFLGGADNRIDKRFIESHEFRLIENPISTAEAYLLDIDSCRLRLAWLEANLIDLPADHFLKTLDEELRIRHYWVSEPLATQGSITGRSRTALDSSRGTPGLSHYALLV